MLLTKNPLPLVVGEVRVLFFRFIELRLDLKRKEIVKTKENKVPTRSFYAYYVMNNGHAAYRNVMFNSTPSGIRSDTIEPQSYKQFSFLGRFGLLGRMENF